MKYWYCIYTKYGQEDLVCKRLKDLPDLELFTPKLKRKKTIRSKVVEVVEQLFPSYVFSKFDPLKYLHLIRYSTGVRRFVGDQSETPYIVDDSIIDFIKSRARNGYVHLETPKLEKGEKIVVSQGPLEGLPGLVLSEIKPSERVMILLNTIQFRAKVVLSKECITKVQQ